MHIGELMLLLPDNLMILVSDLWVVQAKGLVEAIFLHGRVRFHNTRYCWAASEH